MHRRNGHHIGTDEAYNVHPIEEIEPEQLPQEVYRIAALKFTALFNPALQHIGAAIHRARIDEPWLTDIKTAYWQVCYALGLQMCEGRSMTERAESIGVERATISKGARSFCAAHNLPPSFYMKSEDAAGTYQKERIERVRRGCNKPKLQAA